MKMNHSAKRAFLLLAALLLTAIFTVNIFAAAADTTADDPAVIADTVNADGTADDAADDADEAGIRVTLDRLPENLGRMGVGMLCIIIVMGVLIGVTLILNKVTAPKDNNK